MRIDRVSLDPDLLETGFGSARVADQLPLPQLSDEVRSWRVETETATLAGTHSKAQGHLIGFERRRA
jgi:hypothetical protein